MKKEIAARIVVLCFVVTALFFCMQSETFSADWPQIGFDAQRTGFNPDEVTLSPSNVGNLEVLWTNDVPCTINTGVSVADGVVYYGHYCGQFIAVNANTGARLWSRTIQAVHTGQAVVHGVAYVATRCTYGGCGRLYAFDAKTGQTIWTWIPTNREIGNPVVEDEIVYISSNRYTPENGQFDHLLHALDATTGEELWNHSPGGMAAVADGVVYITTRLRIRLQAVSSANGELLWTAFPGGSEISWPAVSNGIVYVHSDDGHLYAFNAGGCGEAICSPLWRGNTQPDSAQPPAIAEGKVYAGAGDTFFAFDANGCGDYECSALWATGTACTFFPGGNQPPSIANGVVYSTCDNSYIYGFDASNGDVLWEYYTAGTGYPMRSSPAIVDGRVFHAATFDFQLYAFIDSSCEDNDEDGYKSIACGGNDCNDSVAAVNPGATEGPFGDPSCADTLDNDCDGDMDIGDSGCCECIDNDLDGYGLTLCDTCTYPQLDCDDTDADVNPGKEEDCANGIDDNCDGLIDSADCDCPPYSCVDFNLTAPSQKIGNTCGAGNDVDVLESEEHVYAVTIPSSGTWTFSLCGSGYDTFMLVGTLPGAYDVGYDDDGCGYWYGPSSLTVTIPAGTYFVDVEGYYPWDCGDYVLVVSPPSSRFWSAAAEANASAYGHGSLEAAGISNPLSILLLPLGTIILLKILRKRKQGSCRI